MEWQAGALALQIGYRVEAKPRDLSQRFAGEGIVSYLRAGKARRSIANKIGLPTRVLCSTAMLEVDAFLSPGEVYFLLFFG